MHLVDHAPFPLYTCDLSHQLERSKKITITLGNLGLGVGDFDRLAGQGFNLIAHMIVSMGNQRGGKMWVSFAEIMPSGVIKKCRIEWVTYCQQVGGGLPEILQERDIVAK